MKILAVILNVNANRRQILLHANRHELQNVNIHNDYNITVILLGKQISIYKSKFSKTSFIFIRKNTY